jgi:hypothetical protein
MREGLKYERAFAAALLENFPSAQHGQWWKFEDAGGIGWAQTDLFLPEENVVVEVKLTLSLQGLAQLENFYVPLLECATGERPRAILVTKNLRPVVPRERIYSSWAECVSAKGGTPILHWLRGPVAQR